MTATLTTARPLTPPVPRGKRPVRVCFVIDRLNVAGTESQLLALIHHLDRRRVEPTLCLLDGEDCVSRDLQPADCPVLRLGVRKLFRGGTIPRAWRFARFLREHRADVVQSYFPDSSYLATVVARAAGIRFVLRVRNDQGFWMTPAHRWAGRLLNPLVDRTLVNCDDCRLGVLANERANPRTIEVMENGVDLSRFVALPSPRSSPHPRVGVVANLRAVKGLDVFVRAAARVSEAFPHAQFEIAGEGELRSELSRLAEQLSLGGRLRLAGSLRDVAPFLGSLNVAVLCSRSEGMSNALLEYMAAARPIVATATGAARHLLQDGTFGTIVPVGDPAALNAAIIAHLADPARAARLGQAARKHVVERYSREAMVRRFEAFYHRLLWPGE